MKKVCYLAGLISTDFPQSISWRLAAESALHEHATVLSPMRGKDDLFCTSQDGGLTDPSLTAGDIVLRDYNDIQTADIVLVNLDDFGSPRAPMGTLCELAWAWERRIPIIAVASPDNTLMRNHPFLKAMVTRYFEDLDSAVAHVLSYYLAVPVTKRWVN
jgi:nucleoside 2-deoxyribosyltransferase